MQVARYGQQAIPPAPPFAYTGTISERLLTNTKGE